jgi:xanthine dehydrogenase YagT iron-sulfur-binding subunit
MNSPEDSSAPAVPADGVSRREFVVQAGAASAGAVLARELVRPEPTMAEDTLELPPTVTVKLRINGTEHTLELDPRVTLLDALRERLGLTGSKKGCDHGQCGACTVLVNGRRINSCLALAAAYDGDEITTIEGLAKDGQLHPLQAAFIQQDGFQCGYCTPGQICSAVALLEHEGCPDSDEGIRELMSGNLCRCGAYNGIVDAIKAVRSAKANAA